MTSVEGQFARNDPDEPWVTGITEHPTREGTRSSRGRARVSFGDESSGGQSTHHQRQLMATTALGMAIDGRRPTGSVIDSDQGP